MLKGDVDGLPKPQGHAAVTHAGLSLAPHGSLTATGVCDRAGWIEGMQQSLQLVPTCRLHVSVL